MLELTSVSNFDCDRFDLPLTFYRVLLYVNAKIQALIEVKGEGSFAHGFGRLAFTLLCRLTFILLYHINEIIVDVLLNEVLGMTLCLNKSIDMTFLVVCSEFLFEIKFALPIFASGF